MQPTPQPGAVYLGIDTATPFLALALWSPEHGTLARFAETLERDHAKRLLDELGTLLSDAGLTKRHITGVGVGLGPGSYTGLRVGVAAAQGVARGLGVPLGGGSTLAAVAAGVFAKGAGSEEVGAEVCEAVVALDARRGNVYAGVFAKQGEAVTCLQDERKWDRAALRAAYPHLPYFEDGVPDASYLARSLFRGEARAVEPVYL